MHSKMPDPNFEGRGEEIINLFAKIRLEELESSWISYVITADFSEVEDMPLSFEDLHANTNFVGLFNGISQQLREYVDLIQSDGKYGEAKRISFSFLSTSSLYDDDYAQCDKFSQFWINITKSFKVKSLLSFLFYYIYRGQRYNANEMDRELSIQASSLYFLLLAIPGSNAFRIFHPVLYIKALDVLKLTIKLNIAATCFKKSGSHAHRTSHRSSNEDRAEGMDEDFAEQSFLDLREANKLIRLLNILLNDFMRLLKIFSLKLSPESLEESISVLVQVTRCEIQYSKEVFIKRHSANTLSALCYNSYVALQSICNSLHGSITKIIMLVMKHILQSILMSFCGSSEYPNKALGNIREHSMIFVKYLMLQLNTDTFDGIFILIQHLCLRVPDKADFREKIAKSVVELMQNFSVNKYSACIIWLFQFSHNEKAGHRLFTLEVVSKLLSEKELCFKDSQITENVAKNESPGEVREFRSVPPDHDVVPENRDILSHKFLLSIIFSRCRDSAATVRSKALALLAECTLSQNVHMTEDIKKIFLLNEPVVFTTPHLPGADINCESPNENLKDVNFPNSDMIMIMLQRRAQDERVTVRKSALQVIENLLKLSFEMVTEAHLKILLNHCRDPALLIRKQMVNSLTAVVIAYPGNLSAIKTWVLGVLPLSLDPEAKVQEKVVEFVDQLLFQRVRPYENGITYPADQMLPWRLLDTITKLSYHKFLKKIMMLWSKSEYARPQVMNIVETHVGGNFNHQAWTFLSIISQYMEMRNPLFAFRYFEENFILQKGIRSSIMKDVLSVLCYSIKYIEVGRAVELQKFLMSKLTSFSIDVELISSIVTVNALISYKIESDEAKGTKSIESWAAPILKSCDDYLKQILFPRKPSVLTDETEEEIFRYLYTLGEVAQFSPSKVNKRMFLMLQSIIFHQKHSNLDPNSSLRIPSTQTQSSQAPQISFTPTSKLQNLSAITLAKMCLQHEDQAKRIIPAMGKMLESTTLPSMKINIVIALSDMCVRYATLVDPLMPQVTACLRDPDLDVRKTTLTLLISLLQEDYLKLKDSFFYRILQCLCDEHEELRNTVDFYMTERLLKRSPKVFLQHFVECIFHYNCYEEHEIYNKFRQSKKEKDLFSLAGSKHRDRRMFLYRFMLDHMLDDQRFATTQRLCQDVLGGVVDGKIRLTPSSLPMLEDTLMVLSSEEIKLTWLKSNPDDADQPSTTDEQAEMAGIAIKKTIISQVVKRNVIDNIVPILISLKQKLEENRSPLMKQLLLYFKEIMKDYKNEVKEILAGDKLIAKEIEFDLRKLEEEQKREAEMLEAQNKSSREKKRKCPDVKQCSLGNSPKLPKLDSVSVHTAKEGDVDNVASGSHLSDVHMEASQNLDQEEESENSESSSEPDTEAPQTKSPVPLLVSNKRKTRSLRQEAMINNQMRKSSNILPVAPAPNLNVTMTKSKDIGVLNTSNPNQVKSITTTEKADTVILRKDDSINQFTEHVSNCDVKELESIPECPEMVPAKNIDQEKHPENSESNSEPETEAPQTKSPAPRLVSNKRRTRSPGREAMINNQIIEASNKLQLTPAPNLNLNTTKSEDIGVLNTSKPRQDKSITTIEKADTVISRKDDFINQFTEHVSHSNAKELESIPECHEKVPAKNFGRSTAGIKENLMRAISTPNATQKVINNITFIDQSQNLSGISLNDSDALSNIPGSSMVTKTNASQTLLIHFKSPDAFAKDEQFNRVRGSLGRRSSKKVPNEEIVNPRKKKKSPSKAKKSLGGFLQSFASDTANDETCNQSDDSNNG